MQYKLKAILLAGVFCATTATADDLGISVSVGQPGFYGRIDIGGYPRPLLIYPEPRIVHFVSAYRPPVYMRVPPGHAKHWDRHCRKYDACGERVYFVRDDWYRDEYLPRHRGRHGRPHD